GDLELSTLEEKNKRIKLEKKIKKIKKKITNDKGKQEKYDRQLSLLETEEQTTTKFVESYKNLWVQGVEEAIARGNSVFPVIGGAVGGLIAAGVGYTSIGTVTEMYRNEKTEKLLEKAYKK
ncbi:4967_t:CDS:1, partial [Cetraspora pellucida]